MSKSEEFVNAGNAVIVGSNCWDGGEVTIDGKAKGSPDSRNAADDIGAVDGGGVPSVSGDVDCFGTDFGVAGSLIGGDGEGLVEEAKETLNRDRLVVAAEAWLAR